MLHAWSNFDRTFNELDRVLRAASAQAQPRGLQPHRLGSTAERGPELELEEDETGWVLTADVAGITIEDVAIEARDGLLHLRAQRTHAPPEGYRILRRERRPWTLDHKVRLPEGVQIEEISARLQDGRLSVRLPRRPESEPRLIPVETD